MIDEWLSYDATGLAQLVQSGAVAPIELVDAAIARIEALEPTLNALAHRHFDEARERAKGSLSGPFAGVPTLLKDLLMYPGMPCRMGSRLFAQHIPQDPSPYSQTLDASGLIPLGKTTTSELGLLGSTETFLHGTTRNPWNLKHSALGSSGGAAAAVASGMVPFAHASDGGGSIRLPAAACGLFGFKPGAQRTVSTGPIHPLFADLLIEHCISRSVRDSALFYATMERRDHPSFAPAGFVSKPTNQTLRIGAYTTTVMGAQPTEEVARAWQKTIALCRDLGHHVEELDQLHVDGKGVSDVFFAFAGAVNGDIFAMMEPMLGRLPGDAELEPFTLALWQWYQKQPTGFLEAQFPVLETLKRRMATHFERYDVLLSPTMPDTALPLGTLAPKLEREVLIERTERLAGYTSIYNMIGAPAMSAPLFQGKEGTPIGSHFAAAPGQEAMLLGLAYQLEEAQPWDHKWPDCAHLA